MRDRKCDHKERTEIRRIDVTQGFTILNQPDLSRTDIRLHRTKKVDYN